MGFVPGEAEAAERYARLRLLAHELHIRGLRVRYVHPRRRPPQLRVTGTAERGERVCCAGAEGIYAFVTVHGRIVGTADESGISDTAKQLAGLLRPPETRRHCGSRSADSAAGIRGTGR